MDKLDAALPDTNDYKGLQLLLVCSLAETENNKGCAEQRADSSVSTSKDRIPSGEWLQQLQIYAADAEII